MKKINLGEKLKLNAIKIILAVNLILGFITCDSSGPQSFLAQAQFFLSTDEYKDYYIF